MGQQLPRSPAPDWRRYVLWMLIWVAFIASLGYAASYGELGFLENSVSVTAEPNREGVPLQSDPVIQVKVTVRNNTRDTVTLKAPSACKMFRWQVFSRDGNMVQSKVTDEDACPKTEVSAILPSGEKLEEFYSIELVPTRYQTGNDYLVQYWYWGYEGEFQFKAE
ncbi:MAG: hypothetical protein SGI91_19760 [Alphaproteobacteria bacterium]|jgi:hypothetical protein|nr:hypothetical protein [Alphaproteobacteria bacterium]